MGFNLVTFSIGTLLSVLMSTPVRFAIEEEVPSFKSLVSGVWVGRTLCRT
jgi:hypothetical protein